MKNGNILGRRYLSKITDPSILAFIPHHEFFTGHRVQPGTQVFKMRELT